MFFHVDVFHQDHKDEEAEETSVLYRWSYTEFDPALPLLLVPNTKHLDHFMLSLFHILPQVIILKWQLGGKREKNQTYHVPVLKHLRFYPLILK